MTLSWDDLRAAIDADDLEAAEKLVLAATEKERRAWWPRVEELTAYSDERRERRRRRAEGALKLAIAGTAPGARQLAATYWLARVPESVDPRAADLLAARNPSWLPDLGRALLANQWGANWRLTRELVRRRAVPQPDDREEYVRQMVGQLYERGTSLRGRLLEDARLLDREVYEIFEHEACAARLASHDHWVTHRWDRGSRRSVPSTERDPHADSWGQVLADLAGEGRLDRQRLLDLALAALVRDATWSRKKWHAGFLDLLAPTVDETAARTGSYLALLASGDGPSVGLGQAAVETLLAADRVRPDELLPVADAPLLRKEKAVALRQLKLLDGLAADPAWAPDMATAMATAFGHPRPDVQERALKLVGRRLTGLPAEVVEELQVAAELCAPSLAPVVADAFGAAPVRSEATATTWEPPPAATLPPPLIDDPAFVEATVAVLAGDRDPLLIERVLEGLLARVDREPAPLAGDLAPAIAAARKAVRSHQLGALIGEAVLMLVEDTPTSDRVRARGSRARNPLTLRIQEVVARLQRRDGGPLLSMPTDAAGRVDPAVLAERELELGHVPAEQVAADRFVAQLRAGQATDWYAMVAGLDWCQPAVYRTPQSEQMRALTQGVMGPLAQAWPLLWPHSPAQSVAYVIPLLRKEVEHEPTAYEPSVTAPLLAWLTQPSVEVGDWTAAALAFALGSRVALHRAAAVDALLALDHGRRITASQVAACLLAADEAEVIKLNRVAQCLAELLPAAPPLARDLALELLPRLIERGHKEAHRFLTVAADAVATAGPVDLPTAVIDVAARKGNSKLVTEARRLVAL